MTTFYETYTIDPVRFEIYRHIQHNIDENGTDYGSSEWTRVALHAHGELVAIWDYSEMQQLEKFITAYKKFDKRRRDADES